MNSLARIRNVFTGPNTSAVPARVYRLHMTASGATYEQETFASVSQELASNGVVFARFTLRNKASGTVSARIGEPAQVTEQNGTLVNTNSDILIWFSDHWKWEPSTKSLIAQLKGDESAFLVVPTKPGKSILLSPEERAHASTTRINLARVYKRERQKCVSAWESLLSSGAQFEVPEPVVNDAWKSLLAGLHMVMKSNSMNYSHGNAYERLYQAECGDAIRALALYGHADTAAKAIPSLLHYTRDALKYHNAGFKLQMLAHYYWLTQDTNFLLSVRPQWTDEINKIVGGREKESGLFPREQYCGDISTPVYSLHSAGAAWRGLRDFATILSEEGALTSSARR